MISRDLAVHRGNSPVNKSGPLEQVDYYINTGFKKIEIDIYALSESTFKFCHPLDENRVSETHDINDRFLSDLVKKYPAAEWFVDLKCLDLDVVPKVMMQRLVDVFGKSATFIAAQPEILEFMHQAGMRTGQYFREGTSKNLSYEPDLYSQSASNSLQYPKQKTILSCSTLDEATERLGDGFAEVMVDGNLIVEAGL